MNVIQTTPPTGSADLHIGSSHRTAAEFWTAPAERSGDGAFERAKGCRINASLSCGRKRCRATLATAVQDALDTATVLVVATGPGRLRAAGRTRAGELSAVMNVIRTTPPAGSADLQIGLSHRTAAEFWTAPAERSGDGAFERAKGRRINASISCGRKRCRATHATAVQDALDTATVLAFKKQPLEVVTLHKLAFRLRANFCCICNKGSSPLDFSPPTPSAGLKQSIPKMVNL
jgi:hypothetical protein